MKMPPPETVAPWKKLSLKMTVFSAISGKGRRADRPGPEPVAQSDVADAATGGRREVAAHPVPGDRVRVGAGAHGDAAACPAEAAVEHHLVVVDLHEVVIGVDVKQAVRIGQ